MLLSRPTAFRGRFNSLRKEIVELKAALLEILELVRTVAPQIQPICDST